MIIARFVFEATDNTPRFEVCVDEDLQNKLFTVSVTGSCLSDGRDKFVTGNVRVACSYAAQEIAAGLEAP